MNPFSFIKAAPPPFTAPRNSPLTGAPGQKITLSPDVIRAANIGEALPTVAGAGTDGHAFFAPGQPLAPQAQETARNRQWDYPWGTNLAYTPRYQEAVSFAQLRQLADSYDLMRLLIETRKDQLVKFRFNISPRDPNQSPDERCLAFEEFLRFPDRRHNWQTWLRVLLEDMLVTDAATVQPVFTRSGELYALDLFDGATLHIAIDETGRIPSPPSVAYQQILKGLPAVDYTSDELIYAPRNVRVNRLYGYSPVEQVIMTVNIALRRQISQLQYFTEGNIPEALMSVPKEWTPEQISRYQDLWDDMYGGNTARRRRMKFVPDGSKYIATKDEVIKDWFDEWLARICCYAFSLPPAPFVKEQNRATAETAKEAAREEGLQPLMQWIKDLIDLVLVKYLGHADLEFQWADDDPTSPIEMAEMNERYVKCGIKSIDECRQDIGMDGLTKGAGNVIFTGAGAVLVTSVLHPEEDPNNPAHPDHPENPKNVAAANAATAAAAAAAAKPTPPAAEPQAKSPVTPEVGVTKMLDLHVHMPKAPDVLVDVGDTTINANFEKSTKRVTTSRTADGGMIAVVDDGDGHKQIVKAHRDKDGGLSAKVEHGSAD